MAVLAQEPFAAEYSTTTGDGAITLGGRVGNYKTLAEAGVANTNVVLAEIRLVSGGVTTEYEVAFYTYASSGPTLTIVGSPLRSSNSNNKVSWSAGTKQVVLSSAPFQYPRDDRFVLVGSADYTKRARFEVDGITTGQTRALIMPDHDATPLSYGSTALQATTSGTFLTIGSLPAGIKRALVNFYAIGTAGTGLPIVQLGSVADGIVITGYSGGVDSIVNGSSPPSAQLNSTGVKLAADWSSASRLGGCVEILRTDGANRWMISGNVARNDAAVVGHVSAFVALTGELDRVNFENTAGDALTAGSINVTYYY